jgi:hypothetical protein
MSLGLNFLKILASSNKKIFFSWKEKSFAFCFFSNFLSTHARTRPAKKKLTLFLRLTFF